MQRRFWPRTTRAAVGLILRWEVLGGCPFAQDALVGNIPTEKVIEALTQRGAALPPLKPLDSLLKATAGIGARFSSSEAAD